MSKAAYRIGKWILIYSMAALALAGMGCDGCESVPTSTSAPLQPDDLTGMWVVSSYAADEEGCKPESAPGPFDRIRITIAADAERGDGEAEGGQRLALLPCLTTEACTDEVVPENELVWNAQHRRAERTHHYATHTQTSPVEVQCRLSTIRTLLIADGEELELTRSYYDLDLPIEGDEACNAELAAQYHAHMTCHRSEVIGLSRPEAEDGEV